jgi:DNA oxidative demethylase
VPDGELPHGVTALPRLSLHQDKNERDFGNPIVSVSLGLPATFQFGGLLPDPLRNFNVTIEIVPCSSARH